MKDVNTKAKSGKIIDYARTEREMTEKQEKAYRREKNEDRIVIEQIIVINMKNDGIKILKNQKEQRNAQIKEKIKACGMIINIMQTQISANEIQKTEKQQVLAGIDGKRTEIEDIADSRADRQQNEQHKEQLAERGTRHRGNNAIEKRRKNIKPKINRDEPIATGNDWHEEN
jgi:hypothetical protein